ncbi:two-component regulatory system sensor kinase [Caballeronia arvi]|uniref:Two-component regulatory system sensor kinase n=1 Tax=Caballeronia arvi TaxID=1777135 RepID=A0A158L0E6_9BURK|nr:response regulator [Caballeronia arvi]SAL86844.1 two-component regulatory system sensor kinase [Caballeronia arvi]
MATVLLLDDNEMNLSSLQFALELAGHRVLAAEDGRKGLQLLAANCAHVIVTDWQMPVMDGVEFCVNLRGRVIFCRAPVILLSANPEPENLNRPWTIYFRKPVQLPTLLEAVESFAMHRPFRQGAEGGGERLTSRWAGMNPRCWP